MVLSNLFTCLQLTRSLSLILTSVEVLARATSVKDSLDHLKSGTYLWKLRDKGVRGIKLYRRRYRLNIADLIITYTPNKGVQNNCFAGNPNSNSSARFINLYSYCSPGSTVSLLGLSKLQIAVLVLDDSLLRISPLKIIFFYLAEQPIFYPE